MRRRGVLVALPNKRLKLAAPVLKSVSDTPAFRCCRIPFVNLLTRRRSLSAFR